MISKNLKIKYLGILAFTSRKSCSKMQYSSGKKGRFSEKGKSEFVFGCNYTKSKSQKCLVHVPFTIHNKNKIANPPSGNSFCGISKQKGCRTYPVWVQDGI